MLVGFAVRTDSKQSSLDTKPLGRNPNLQLRGDEPQTAPWHGETAWHQVVQPRWKYILAMASLMGLRTGE